MHPYFMLAAQVLAFTIQTIAFKAFNTRYMKGLPSYFLFQVLHFGIVTLFLLVINKGLGEVSRFTLISACVWGVLFVSMLLSYMKAMETGPLSFSALFSSSSVLIPISWGVLFWNERVSPLQIAGLALLFFTYYLGAARGGSGINRRWIFFVFASFLLNGSLSCVSKQHQLVMQGTQIYEFLILGFASAFAICVCGLVCTQLARRRSLALQEIITPLDARFWGIVSTAGIVTAIGNILFLLVTTRLPSVVQFPVAMGGTVIFTTFVSVLHYKERLSRRGAAAMVIGILSLIMLSL